MHSYGGIVLTAPPPRGVFLSSRSSEVPAPPPEGGGGHGRHGNAEEKKFFPSTASFLHPCNTIVSTFSPIISPGGFKLNAKDVGKKKRSIYSLPVCLIKYASGSLSAFRSDSANPKSVGESTCNYCIDSVARPLALRRELVLRRNLEDVLTRWVRGITKRPLLFPSLRGPL